MITLISTVVVATLFNTTQTESKKSNTNGMNLPQEVFEESAIQPEKISNVNTFESKEFLLDEKNDQPMRIVEKENQNELYSPKKSQKVIYNEDKTTHFETIYKFPVLTEKEKIENQKRKRKMLKYLVKFNKKEYAFVPSGSLTLKNEKKSIQSFYIQTTEVTNIQYRTFLMDLVEKGDKEKFKMASPQLDVWPSLKEPNQNNPLNDAYFSHPAYDAYPVVGITQKGAELYCEWLSKEVIAYSPKKAYDNVKIKVRIPTDIEWMYCANEGSGEIKYGTPHS